MSTPPQIPDFIPADQSPDFIPDNSGQKVPQSVLDNLRATTQTTQGGANYGKDLSLLQGIGGMAQQGYGMAKGLIKSAADAALNPAAFGESVGAGVDRARQAMNSTPDDAQSRVFDVLRNLNPMIPMPSESFARAGFAMLGADPDAFSEAVRQRNPVKATVAATPAILAAGGPELARRIGASTGAAVEGLKKRMQGALIADPSPTANLAGAMSKGGAIRGNVAPVEVATPELADRFAQAHARLENGNSLTSESFQKGQYTPENFRATARETVADINNDMNRYTAPMMERDLPAGMARRIANELRAEAASTNIESRANALNKWADTIERAKTGGDLLKAKSDAFNDASRGSFSEITADAGADAAHDAGSAIIRNYYPEISKVAGKDVGPIGELEKNAITLQSQAEKAFPKLTTIEANRATTPFSQRINPLDWIRPKVAASNLAQSAMTPADAALFKAQYRAAVRGGVDVPKVQGPMNAPGGKYRSGQNPLGPPDTGSPLPGGGTISMPDVPSRKPTYNPYSNPTGTQPKMANMVTKISEEPTRTSEAESSLTGRSNEALTRLQNDLKAGRKYFRVNTRTGQHTPVTELSPEDITLNPGEELRYFPKPEWPDYSELVKRRQ